MRQCCAHCCCRHEIPRVPFQEFQKQIAKASAELEEKFKQADGNILKALAQAGAIVEADAKVNLRNSGHVDTGTLLRSITHIVDADKHQAYVGTNVEYGKWIEFGTRKMKPSYFLTRAINKNRARIKAIIAKATQEGLNK